MRKPKPVLTMNKLLAIADAKGCVQMPCGKPPAKYRTLPAAFVINMPAWFVHCALGLRTIWTVAKEKAKR